MRLLEVGTLGGLAIWMYLCGAHFFKSITLNGRIAQNYKKIKHKIIKKGTGLVSTIMDNLLLIIFIIHFLIILSEATII